ncbi:intermembrane transport protein PqiB [Catenovulum maritimum]|uniref:Mce/MlaD domain-containing protein n=1 Tax=Catenovulum maritimum TaxID=1513271 RepID=A0A0J8GRL7_9ALTE|nr:MlaD family protein [Catenovulum maritimum]KMT63934.1 hypothetical protein XM47_17050 [Catenovulum maritimum]
MIKANIKKNTKLSSVWLIPLFAIFISSWFVVKHYMERGTEIEIRFNNAEGIDAKRTQIKALNVDVGTVIKVQINDDLKTVTVIARIKPQAVSLLRQDSEFWVVKPRIGSKGVSGLGTLLSGAYIELEPGQDSPGRTQFVGLENPPLTRVNKGGINLSLISHVASSINPSDPVLYQGVEVGQVTNVDVTVKNKIKTSIFIEAPYSQMINSNTRFYNASGLSFRLSSQGLDMHSQSMESILTGGVAFELGHSSAPPEAVTDGDEFTLFENKRAVLEHPYKYFVDYLLLFDGSVRGLTIGEVVEYRGIKIGSVIDIDFKYLDSKQFEQASMPLVPVLVRLYPGHLFEQDTPEARERLVSVLSEHVNKGLKAALKTGSLVSGQSLVQLDFYSESNNASVEKVGQYLSLPTINDNLDVMLTSLNKIMLKIEALPLDNTLTQVNSVVANMDENLNQVSSLVKQVNNLVEQANKLLNSEQVNQLPGEVNETLRLVQNTLTQFTEESGTLNTVNQSVDNLNQALLSIQKLVEQLEQTPDALIWGKQAEQEVRPGEGL